MYSRRATGPQATIDERNIEWVVVANRTGARFFTRTGAKGKPRKVDEMTYPRGRLHDRELVESERGRTFDSAENSEGRHAMEPTTYPHEQESQLFARSIAERIRTGRLANDYDKVILVAEPHFLGVLLKELDEPTKKTVRDTIKKNLATLSDHDLVLQLNNLE